MGEEPEHGAVQEQVPCSGDCIAWAYIGRFSLDNGCSEQRYTRQSSHQFR